jgi:hypothetical protein
MTIFRCSGILPGIVAVAALMLAGCSSDASAEAERLGRAYCRIVMDGDEAGAEALMTPALRAQIAGLRAFDARFRADRPGDAPPLDHGLRLAAYPDVPQDCDVTVETPARVIMTYVPKGDPGAFWRDRLLLVRSGDGRLTIGDIEFGTDTRVRLRAWINESTAG